MALDIQLVDANIMSRRTFNMKWRNMTSDKANEELQRCIEEAQMFDNFPADLSGGGEPDGDN